MTKLKHMTSSVQQRLVCGVFYDYKTKMQARGFSVNLKYPEVYGDHLSFVGGRWGMHIGFGLYELTEFLEHLNKIPLYDKSVELYLSANGEHFLAQVGDSPEQCVDRVDQFYHQKRIEVEESPKTKQRGFEILEMRRDDEIVLANIVGQLTFELDRLDTAKWVCSLVQACNGCAKLSGEQIAHLLTRLELKGYEANALIGTEKWTFELQVRWTVGQIMNFLLQGDPPPSILRHLMQEAIDTYMEKSHEPTSDT